MNSPIFSTPNQIGEVIKILCNYVSLPFTPDTIPGAIVEATLAHVREGTVLQTYDFIDVLHEKHKIGWQVKSTKASTPVTWKRAKIPNALTLIKNSFDSEEAAQVLGDSLMDFCNGHALASINAYNLNEIGYARAILHSNNSVSYFERKLCDSKDPIIFKPSDFSWKWSDQKKVVKKEQLKALHGFHRASGKKWWAWHGLGENQLHFSGEKYWWNDSGSSKLTVFKLPLPEQRLSLQKLMELLSKASD